MCATCVPLKAEQRGGDACKERCCLTPGCAERINDLLLECSQIQTRMSGSMSFLMLRGCKECIHDLLIWCSRRTQAYVQIGLCLTAEVRQIHNSFLVQVHGAPRWTELLHGSQAARDYTLDTLLSQAVA